MKILIAEDCPSTQRLLHAMIERWGYETVVTGDGAEAYRNLLVDEEIELAIVDWEMPGMSGPEVCRALERASRNVYCILLTGKAGVESMAEALEAGASDYVRKPCCPTELRARIRSGERLLRLQKQVGGASHPVEGAETEHAIADIQELAGNLRKVQQSYASVTQVMGDVRQLLEGARGAEGLGDAVAAVEASMEEAGLSAGEGDVPRLVVETQRMVRSLSERLHCLLDPTEEAEESGREPSFPEGTDEEGGEPLRQAG